MIVTVANFVFIISRHKDSDINIVLKRLIGILAALILLWVGLSKLINAIDLMTSMPN